ncbi:MAG: hypothetical protein HYU86_09235 [Chloroflexi bacterium]|nr:hypothetical protein [Chloroflexota bacterium]
MEKFCPGSRSLKNPTPEYIPCPNCGTEVEIWSDETSVKCHSCHGTVARDRNMSCIDWCQFAEKCFGPQVVAKVKGSQAQQAS